MDRDQFTFKCLDILYYLLFRKEINNFKLFDKSVKINNRSISFDTKKELLNELNNLYISRNHNSINHKKDYFNLFLEDNYENYTMISYNRGIFRNYYIHTLDKNHYLCKLYKCPLISFQKGNTLFLINLKSFEIIGKTIGVSKLHLKRIFEFLKSNKRSLLAFYKKKISSLYLERRLYCPKLKLDYNVLIKDLLEELLFSEKIKTFKIHKYYLRINNKIYFGTKKSLCNKVLKIFKNYYGSWQSNTFEETLLDKIPCLRLSLTNCFFLTGNITIDIRANNYISDLLLKPKIAVFDPKTEIRIPMLVEKPDILLGNFKLSDELQNQLPSIKQFVIRNKDTLIEGWKKNWNDTDLHLK